MKLIGYLFAATALVAATQSANAQTTIGTVSAGGNCYPYACGPNDGVTRYQEGFRAGAFSGPLTFNTLTYTRALTFGPNYDTGTYTIDFYYSANPFDQLSGTLSSNTGTLIGSFGSFVVSGPAGPQLSLAGSTLTYDPTLGDLLLDVSVSNAMQVGGYSNFFQADYVGDDVSRAYASNFGSFGSQTGALVTTFSLASGVPEPATWAMMLIGFGATGFAMRRRAKVRTTVSFA